MLLLLSADLLAHLSQRLISNITFSRIFFKNTIKMSKVLDPDQDRRTVCKDYQQMTKVAASKERADNAL